MPALPASAHDELVRILAALDPGQLDHWYGPDSDPSQVAADLVGRLYADRPLRESRQCGRTLPHLTHLTLQGRTAYRCPGIPLAPAPPCT
ncbi:MAG TPA: hypothetical protein VK599_14625 [Streptosporangiaceae bacterium]|nr:hypothetical protein [Streptosporangiaceae bacterium]